MISEQDVKNWQTVWSSLLNMTYLEKDIVSSMDITLPFDKSWQNASNFQEVTFEYMWQKYSMARDDNGNYLEPKPVPELKNLTVPLFLFKCFGSSVFLQNCFPNCTLRSSEP